MTENSFYLNIADFIIHFYSENNNKKIYVPEGFRPFICHVNKKPDVSIKVCNGFPFNTNEAEEIFRAHDFITSPDKENDILWSVYKHKGKDYIISAEPHRKIYPYLCAYFPETQSNWEVYTSEAIEENGFTVLNPLAYPMGPLLMYHLALYNNAIMIHASGIADDNKAYLFSGFSGVGKSTMAGLWYNSGHKVINDDRLMLRYIDGQCIMYNTPMTYADMPKKNVLSHAFLLKQHPENYLTHLKGLVGMTRFMAFCIQHHYNKQHVDVILDTVQKIAQTISVYELGFVPDISAVELIKEHVRKS